ncbi:MAG: SDR family oxidoreductase [Myxococcales bacterium]|nr:SDR family oxidoreductase [Myxococcales bacterium]
MATNAQTILITGATAGIGRHLALHLARAGHHVIATGRNTALLTALQAEAAGARLDMVRLDVTDGASITSAALEVDRLTSERGVDVLINNAGYGLAGALEEISDQDFRAQFETNVFGLMAVTRAFLPRMRARGAGRILNVSSIGGRVTFPMFGAYHASKYAVEALSDALRNELSPFGIQVVLIEPGPIRSEFSDRTMKVLGKYAAAPSPYASVYARAGKIQAISDKNAAGPESVSRAVDHALRSRSPQARYVMPFQMNFMLMFLKSLPTRWTDWVMRQFVGLTPRRLAAAKQAQPAVAVVEQVVSNRSAA